MTDKEIEALAKLVLSVAKEYSKKDSYNSQYWVIDGLVEAAPKLAQAVLDLQAEVERLRALVESKEVDNGSISQA